MALDVLDRNYKNAVAAAAGDPRRLAELNAQYADFLTRIGQEIPAVRVASLGVRDSEAPAPASATRSTMSLADQRRSAALILENDRARIEDDLEHAQQLFRASSGWLPEDSDKINTRDAFRSASDRLAAVLDDPASSEAELTQARLDQHLARLAFDQARSPKRSDPDPLMAGLSGFLDEAGSRAFALVTLGGSVGIDRAMKEGRINARSGPLDVFQAYLEGVFNGITFGGADAFVNARAGEGKGLGASLAAGFQQLGSSAIALEELAILADPKRSSWEKAEAGASLVAKWAGLAAGGVAGGRAARARFEAWRTGRAAPAPAAPPVETPKALGEAEAAGRTHSAETRTTIDAKSGETVATRVGKDVHHSEAETRRAGGNFDLVNEPIRDKNGNPIRVPKRVDLKTGQPQPGARLQESVPDAVSFKKGLIIDDKPLGRPIAKDRQEIIRAIKAYEAREGVLPKRIAIPRYDPKTGQWIRTDLYRPEDFLPRPRRP